jgi:uncharacterized delta-60 repeat protein
MKLRKLHSIAALAAMAATSTAAPLPGPGNPDPSFNSDGVTTASYGGTETANAVAVMPNGKIVVVGTTNVLGSSDVAVLRYNANGSLDTSFDNDGGVITDIGAATADVGNAVAVQPDGKILVVGTSGADILILRYNVNGSLDSFFGGGGKIVTNVASSDNGSSIALQNDGKILVAGSAFVGADANFALLRFNSDGSPDTTFSGDGRHTFTFGAEDICQAIALQADGKIVMAGHSNAETDRDFALARLNADGSMDSSFDVDGTLLTDLDKDDTGNAVLIQPDGKIVVGGASTNSGDVSNFSIARYNSNGALDTSFSNDGFLTETFGSEDQAKAMVLQKDGKLLLAGFSNAADANDFALLRVTSNGIVDTTFDTEGEVLTNITGTDAANAMVLQPDGRAVVAGSSGTDFALARYHTLIRTDTRLGVKNNAAGGNNIYNSTGAGQSLNPKIKRSGGKKNSFVRIQNDGHDSGDFTITGTGGNGSFGVKYLSGTIDVTNAVKAGTFNTGTLAPGATFLLKVEITAKTKNAGKNRNFLVTSRSTQDTSSTDTVLIKATSN